MRIRFLPILIAAAIVTVPAKLGNVWQAAQEGGPALAEEKVDGATEAPDAAEASDSPEPAKSQAPTSAAIQGATGAEASPVSSPQMSGDGDGLGSAEFPADPFALTNEELELLQSLATRRAELERREQEIERRLAILTAAETRIEEKIEKLEALRQSIEQATAQSEERQDEQIASLARIYGAMKAKEAAKIFETMEMAILLDVLSEMRERKSAAILAKMDPTRARAVTLQLAQREKLPLAKE
jgi:flagellar motility protein MotE (MotC chaperone)